MAANNEIGTVQPLAEIAAIAHQHDIAFHTDAAQALARIPLDRERCGFDLASFAAHKMYGPKGIGALFEIAPGMASKLTSPKATILPCFRSG